MIALSVLTQEIQSELNGLGLADFKIYTDVGEFQNAYRQDGSNTITRYINGVMETMSPTRMPIRNLQVLTQTFRIGFVLDMDLLEKDSNGDYVEVKTIRAILEKFIANYNGKPFYLTDGDSVSFEITPSYSGITTGTAMQMSPIGNILPIYLDFSCVFIQSGVNANTIDFIVNGENMFYQEYSITRTRTAETNMLANEPSSKTLAQANGISLQLKMPLLNTTQSKAIETDVWSGTQNEAICVERVRHLANNTTIYNAYIMIYGNNAENGSIGQNIGQVVDFVEGKQNELTYSTGWASDSITLTGSALGYGFAVTKTGAKACVIFWGDGKTSHITATQSGVMSANHTYSHAGTYTIRYFIY